jgi:hypothetical protein
LSQNPINQFIVVIAGKKEEAKKEEILANPDKWSKEIGYVLNAEKKLLSCHLSQNPINQFIVAIAGRHKNPSNLNNKFQQKNPPIFGGFFLF